jgi:ADP-ribose pyrophosphatase YjhB (NUDIX family)
MNDTSQILEAVDDIFDGVTVDEASLPDTPEAFSLMLEKSLAYWKERKRRGVWIKIPLKKATFVPVAAEVRNISFLAFYSTNPLFYCPFCKHHFVFHHAKPDYVMMTRWLPEDEENKLPHFTTHFVGIGGLVLNENNELLCVRERFVKHPHWKLPGGLVDPGEDLHTAVVREVFEETSVKTEFQSIICFRHFHGAMFGASDLYFVARLKPLSTTITIDPTEIDEARWMPLTEFIEHPHVNVFNRKIAQIAARNNSPRTLHAEESVSGNDEGKHHILTPWQQKEFRSVPVPTWNQQTACLYYVECE